MYTQCVALLALSVGLAHCFSWDVVLGGKKGLHFYNNGTLTYSEDIPSAYVFSVTYDPVYNRVLFSDHTNLSEIYSFDIATKKTQTLVSCESGSYSIYTLKFAYDPVTETLFRTAINSIYSFSIKPGSNKSAGGNLLCKLDESPRSIAVDSCAGYIYWTTDSEIERARFDGSEREVIIKSIVWFRPDVAVDQQTQKMYWIDKHYTKRQEHISIESADLNGNNRKTLYSGTTSIYFGTLTVSKDFIYWRGWGIDTYWQLPKNPPHDRAEEPKHFSIFNTGMCSNCESIGAKYKIEDQIQGTRTCEALTSLLPSISSNVPTDVSLLCVHGTKVIGESVCKCTQGYTGERCDVSVCQNYCFQGNCSVTAEQPKCRCNAGYTGERCEVDSCQKYCLNNGVCSLNEESKPVCQCTEDYVGERCDVSTCQSYCFQGNCSVSVEGRPICRCNAGYSGERCEVDACQGYCSNNGVCSLNEESVPVCQCTGDYEGERCEGSVSVFFIKCYRIAPTLSTLRDILDTDVAPVTLDNGVLQLLSGNNGACSPNEP